MRISKVRLAALAAELPPPWFYRAQDTYRSMRLLRDVLVTRRRLVRSTRVSFLAPEIAYTEPFYMVGPGRGEVLVHTRQSAISTSTELSILLGTLKKAFPYWPGYSGVGSVLAIGRGVTQFRCGDRVCGLLKHASRQVASTDTLFLAPQSVSNAAAAMIHIGVIALQGVRKARILPGECAVVVGQGIIGQMALRLARAAGAAPVVAVAQTTARRAVAMANGAADSFAVAEAAEPDQGDVVLEACGTADAVECAVRVARFGARVVLLGSSRQTIPMSRILNQASAKHLRFIGAHVSQLPAADTSSGRRPFGEEAVAYLRLTGSGAVQVDSMVTHVVNPHQANRFFEDLCNDRIKPVAALIDWQADAEGLTDVGP